MKLLTKYLKPHILLILFCFIMLFVQAVCNLYLPNYMADIIDIGIQRGGISEDAPEALSKNGYMLLTTFMDEEEKAHMNSSYELIYANSQRAEDYIETYPTLKEDDIYVKTKLDKNQKESLNQIYNHSVIALIYSLKDVTDKFSMGDSTNFSSSLDSVDINQVYQLVSALKIHDPDIISQAQVNAKTVDSSSLESVGSSVTKLFYNELNVDTAKIQSNYIWQVGLIMLGLTLLAGISSILVSLYSARIGSNISKNIRHDVFKKVQNFSSAEFDNFSTASLITRTTNDVTQVQNLVIMGIRILCYAPIMGIGGIILALGQCKSMSWIIVLGLIIMLGLLLIIFTLTVPKYKLIQSLTDKLNLVSRENLTGLMVIRAFGNQEYEEQRFDKANKDLTSVNLFVNKIMVMMMPLMTLIMNLVCVLIVWVGSHQIENSNLEIGGMMAFMQYAMMIIMAFLFISAMFIMVPRSVVSANRIEEILNTESSIVDSENPQTLENDENLSVEFKNVSFKYEGADDCVLENINFIAEPGKTTAFIGSTGSGKSTLIKLIPRFYDATKGEVLINGKNVKNLSKKELRKKIGFVPQKGTLFSGSIASNLRYGNDEASDEELKIAADISQVTDFIESTPEKFNSEISQGGTNVSGGQKQRLCIARALVKKAPIYIFDDSFSALDFKTDAKLRAALKKYTKNSAVLIVAQRISTIMTADEIIVLDEGKIVGKGTHKELLKTCEVYKSIALSQLSKEELEK